MNLFFFAALLAATPVDAELTDAPPVDADSHAQLQRLLSHPRIPGEFIVEFKDSTSMRDWNRSQRPSDAQMLASERQLLVRTDDETAVRWSRSDRSITITPNLVGKLAGIQTAAGGTNPSGLNRIDQRESIPVGGSTSYQFSTTGRGVIIYILDDAILTSHNDFASLFSDPRTVTNAYNATGTAGAGIQTAHGTQMASIAGGLRGGAAKGATIKGVDVVRLTAWGAAPTLVDVLNGLSWITTQEAANPGPAVVNMSFEFPANTAIDDAVNTLANTYKVTMVSAAGNDSADASAYSPARAKYSLTVGNLNQLGSPADTIFPTSNFGSKVYVFAPGVTIAAADISSISTYSAYPDGTSQSAAHATGVVARYLETHPTATAANTIVAIRDNATSGAINGVLPPNTANRILFSDFTASRINSATLTTTNKSDNGNVIIQKAGATFSGGTARSGATVPPCAIDAGSEGYVVKQVGTSVSWTSILNPATPCGAFSYTSVVGLAVDASGDVYATVNVLDAVGLTLSMRSFLFKLSGGSGAVLWTRQVGGDTTFGASAVAIDLLNRVSFVGTTADTIAGTTSIGGLDGVIVTFDLSGNQVWAKKFGSTANDTAVATVVSNAAIYVAGATSGLMPSAKSLSGTTVSANAGGVDAMLVEIRADGVPGTIQRVLQFGGPADDSASAIARRGTGVVIAGNTSSVLASPRMGGGGQDGFWVSVDSVFQQTNPIQQFGTASSESVTGVFSPALTSDVFVCGTTAGSFTFGMNPGGEDAFVSKYSKAAQFLWDWQSLQTGSEQLASMTSNDQSSDGPAELYLTGSSTTPSWPTVGGLGGQEAFVIRLEGY